MSDFTGPGVYRIQNSATNTVMDLYASGKADGTKINGWEWGKYTNQLWVVANAGVNEYEYLILNAATGTYLTAPSNVGEPVTGNLLPPTDPRVRWKIEPTGQATGTYVFKSVADRSNWLNLSAASKANGTPVITYKGTGQKHEMWYLRLINAP